MTNTQEETMEQEVVQDEKALLTAYNNLKEDVKRLSGELKEVKEAKTELENAAKDDAWRSRALVAELKSSLSTQGIKDADKILKYLNTDGLDFDDKGNLTGLDEKLKEWKADLPQVFDAKVRAGGKADTFSNDNVEPKPNPLADAVHAAMNK